jgi:hypothetical protein
MSINFAFFSGVHSPLSALAFMFAFAVTFFLGVGVFGIPLVVFFLEGGVSRSGLRST